MNGLYEVRARKEMTEVSSEREVPTVPKLLGIRAGEG